MANEPDIIAGSGESWIGKGHQALYRGISTAGAIALGISASGLSYTGLLPFSTVAGMWAGSDLPGILSVALAISLVIAYTYAVIGAAVPRAGADYILASRVLSAPAAFVSSWILVIISGLAAGSVAAFIPMVILPTFGRVIAANSGLPGLVDLVNSLQQPQAMILIGTLLVVGTFVCMFVPQRWMIRILSVGAVLILGAWLVIAVAFAGSSTAGFSQSWNQVMGAGSYEQVIPAAQSSGFFPVNNLSRVVLAGVSLALFIYFGYFVTTFVAGEIRKPERSLWRASGTSLVISWAVLGGTAYLVERVVPNRWLSAQSFLSLTPDFTGQAVPWIFIYAAVLLPGLLVGLVLAAWIYSLINLIQVYLFFSSRIMLAWAEDGLLPAGMAYVHPRYRSPLVTMLLAAVLVEVGLVNQLMGGFFTTPLNFVYFAMISMLVPVTAVTFFPFLKKNWYQACSPFVQNKIGPLPLVSLTGFLTLIYLIILVILPLWVPGGIAPAGPVEIAIFAFIFIAGLVWYWGRRLAMHSAGSRMEDHFKTLPHSSSDH